MRKEIVLSLALFIGLFVACGGEQKEKSATKKDRWKQTLEEYNLEFSPSADFEPVPVKQNDDLFYNYALAHKTLDLEVRFSVFAINEVDASSSITNPNTLYRTLLMTSVMNVSRAPEYFADQGEAILPVVNDFKLADVRAEFNADGGATSAFKINENGSEFGKGYKWGAMFVIHRDDVCDVVVTIMSKDKEVLFDNLEETFYFLKFAPEEQ